MAGGIAIFLPIVGSLLRRTRDELNRHSQRHDNCCNRAFGARMTTQQPEARKITRRGGGALLDEPELARVLGESERTIRTWRQAGVIPVIVCGYRTRRYKLADVLTALDKRTV